MGIRNAYNDAALAAKAVKEAKEAVSAAKNDYQAAKQKVKDGRLPKSDLDFYKANIVAAELNKANAILGVAKAGATAAASTITGGFNATGTVSQQVDKTSTSTTQGTFNGSSITVGGNARLKSNDKLTVKGSTIKVAKQLDLDEKTPKS